MKSHNNPHKLLGWVFCSYRLYSKRADRPTRNNSAADSSESCRIAFIFHPASLGDRQSTLNGAGVAMAPVDDLSIPKHRKAVYDRFAFQAVRGERQSLTPLVIFSIGDAVYNGAFFVVRFYYRAAKILACSVKRKGLHFAFLGRLRSPPVCLKNLHLLFAWLSPVVALLRSYFLSKALSFAPQP